MTTKAILLLVASDAVRQSSLGFTRMLKDKTGRMNHLVTETAVFMTLLTFLTLMARSTGICVRRRINAMGLDIVIFVYLFRPNISTMAVRTGASLRDPAVVRRDGFEDVRHRANFSAMALCAEFIVLWRLQTVTVEPRAIVRHRQEGHIGTQVIVTGCTIHFRHVMAFPTHFHARLIAVEDVRALRNRRMAGCAHNFRVPLKL